MSSCAHGDNTSVVEVTNISAHGLWLFIHGSEVFLSYRDFPFFYDQTVKAIASVDEVSPGHFFWPELDVDLTLEMIEHPARFPLCAPEPR